MIRYLDEPADLLPIAAREPALGCQMMNWAIAYHGDPFPADIWLSCDKNGLPIGAVGGLGKNIVVLSQNSEATAELVNFVVLLSSGTAERVLCGERFALVMEGLPGFSRSEQPVLAARHVERPAATGFSLGPAHQLEDCWSLLAAESERFAASDKDSWLIRVSRGVRRRQSTVLMVYDGEKPVATAMISGRTESAGLIDSVVTSPAYRGLGYASALVGELVSTLEHEERAACIVPANEHAAELYNRLGFSHDYTQCCFSITGGGA